MVKRMSFFVIILLFIFSAILSACGNQASQSNGKQSQDGDSSGETGNEKVNISISTGGDGGVYYRIGAGMANVINENSDKLNATSEASGGSAENVRLIGSETVEFALGSPTTDRLGYEGKSPFQKEYKNLRGVLGGYLQPGHFVVRKDSDIKSIEDMEGKKVALAVGPIGTFIAQDVFAEYGMKPREDFDVAQLAYSDQVNALKNGQIDVAIITTALPNPAVMQMAEDFPIRIIGGADDKLQKAVKKRNAVVATIPAGTYKGVDYDVKTFAIGATFITHAGVPDDVVYELMDVLNNNFDDFKKIHPQAKEFSKKNISLAQYIPLHPGAEKWLKEHKWIE